LLSRQKLLRKARAGGSDDGTQEVNFRPSEIGFDQEHARVPGLRQEHRKAGRDATLDRRLTRRRQHENDEAAGHGERIEAIPERAQRIERKRRIGMK
jgi:hypothetical protein